MHDKGWWMGRGRFDLQLACLKQRLVAAGLCALALTGCNPVGQEFEQIAAQTTLNAQSVSFPIEAARPRFGDSDPVYEWEGGAPFAFPVHGVDVAKWQRRVDWSKLQQQGVRFAFIKATEGGDLLDEMFAPNWHDAGRAGIERSAYHFLYFCTSAEQQARWYIRNVPRTRGALPPVLDAEWNPKSPTCTIRPEPEKVRAKMKRWMDIVERHYGQRPIIYTTVDFHRDNLVGFMQDETFWLRSTKTHPKVTYPGRSWAFWQYTGTGRIPGASGDIDINVFAGSESAWRDWLKTAKR
ncbi:MAG: GH25 family lysozyme [Pseudomonadota bacterium]